MNTLHHYTDPPPIGHTLINVSHSQMIAILRLKDAGILDAVLADGVADLERREERAMLLEPNAREDDWAALHGMGVGT